MVTFETMIKVVQVDRNDDQPWLVSSPVCSMLNQHKIALCGIARTTRADDLARAPLSGPAFLACLSGRGKVRLGNEWIELSDDEACLQSPIGGPRLRSTSDEPWTFGWVSYRENSKTIPQVCADVRMRGPFTAAPLRHAIEGLHAEASNQRRLGIMESWVDLIQSYVRTFTEPFNNNDRLQVVWSRVQSDLKEPWSVDRLASMVGLSREHLRRVSLESLGRTPMQHVTFLRMRKAAGILTNSEASIAEIAEEVGYSTANAFSDVFLRFTGLRPSAFREQSRLTKPV